MKKLLMLLALGILALGANAQNKLKCEDESKQGDAFANAGDTARVLIRCHESMPLSFYSRADGGSIDPFEVGSEGSYTLYDFHFPTDAADDELKLLSRRVLVVSAKGHDNLEIPLNLSSKQYVKLRVYDPDDNKLNNPYVRYRNEAYQEYKNLNYAKARQLFVQASKMSDADQQESAVNISMVDSVIYYREKADDAFNNAKFLDAYNYYAKVLSWNGDDSYASTRKQESNNHFRSNCDIAFQKAEYFFNEKKYEDAKKQYQIMMDERCYENIPIYASVEARIQLIDDILRSRKDHARVLTYEWAPNTPIGLHYGTYKDHKVGGFFEMDLNTKTIEMLRTTDKGQFPERPELNMAFGWTVKIVKPVWIFFGPGVTGKVYYGQYEEGKFPGKEKDQAKEETMIVKEDGVLDTKKINVGVALSPAIGLLVKYSYFAVRATYSYRYSFNKDLQEFINPHRISLGIGLAF